MDISQMRMMLVLAECESMTTTAKKLHVTQPALTYQLKVIENELGFKVFDRTRTGTSLTPEGAFLTDAVRHVVAEYDETVRLARAMAKANAAGAIRVGINGSSRDAVSLFLSTTRSPVEFALIPLGTSDPVRLLREGVIDFWSTSDAALATAAHELKFAELTKVGQSAFVAKDHALADRTSLNADDLRGETVWLWARGTGSIAADAMRTQLEAAGADIADLIPGAPALVIALIDEGVAVYDDGFLPPSSHLVVQIPIDDALPDTLGLAYLASQESRLTPIATALRDRALASPGHEPNQFDSAAERIVKVLDEIGSTVIRGGEGDVASLVEYGLQLGISARHLLNRGVLSSMSAIGDSFRKGNVDMADMMAAVSTANLAMEVLQPHIAIEDEKPILGSAVIGTVVGDAHDIGKDLVRIMLESRDIKVDDLGMEVPPQGFVDHVRANPDCNLVMISVNRTELLDEVRAIVDALQQAKLRDQLFVMVGGAAADQAFADNIGADAFTSSAEEAADKARDLLSLG